MTVFLIQKLLEMDPVSGRFSFAKHSQRSAPEYRHPEYLLKWGIVCFSVGLGVTSILFLLRTYVRLAIKRSWILEDWTCLVSWTGLVAFCGLTITTLKKYAGVGEWEKSHVQVHQALYWFNASTVLYGVMILSTKISVLLLYRRVFLPHRGSVFDWTIRVLMALVCVFYLITTILKVCECIPRERIWNRTIDGHCLDLATLLNASGLFNTVTDFLMLLVPIKAVWKLQIALKRKIGVVLVFTIGLTAPVFSVVGFVARINISKSADQKYRQPEVLLWAAAELASGLMCVCIPTLAALAHRHRQKPPAIFSVGSGSRKAYSRPRAQFASLDDQDGIQLTYSEAQELVHSPQVAVMTDIEGGVKSDIDSREGGMNEKAEDLQRGLGIMKTVRMEHSYK